MPTARSSRSSRSSVPRRTSGPTATGLVLKLAINISLAVQMLAFSEGLRLAERDGVDVKLAADVMTESRSARRC